MARTAKFPPASHGTGLEASRSDAAGDAPGSAGATGSQKRGRGRPPKSKSGDVSAQPASKPSGRPKRSLAAATPSAGRPRRLSTVRAAESQVTTGGDGSRKRGRPKKDDVAAAGVPAPAKKRGRKPKSEQVGKRTVGRPRKATEGATGQGAADPKELKKKTALLQKKVKLAAEKLKIAVSAITEVQELATGL